MFRRLRSISLAKLIETDLRSNLTDEGKTALGRIANSGLTANEFLDSKLCAKAVALWYACGQSRVVVLPSTSQPRSSVLANVDPLFIQRINSGKYFALDNGNSVDGAAARRQTALESKDRRKFAFQSGTFVPSQIALIPQVADVASSKRKTGDRSREILPSSKSLYNLGTLDLMHAAADPVIASSSETSMIVHHPVLMGASDHEEVFDDADLQQILLDEDLLNLPSNKRFCADSDQSTKKQVVAVQSLHDQLAIGSDIEVTSKSKSSATTTDESLAEDQMRILAATRKAARQAKELARLQTDMTSKVTDRRSNP